MELLKTYNWIASVVSYYTKEIWLCVVAAISVLGIQFFTQTTWDWHLVIGTYCFSLVVGFALGLQNMMFDN